MYNEILKGSDKMSRLRPMYSSVKLNIAITSDNHLDINAKTNKNRIKIIKKTIRDIGDSTSKADAYITVGDNTSRGITENWEAVRESYKDFSAAEQIIFTIGNHDSWSRDVYIGSDEGINNFYKYSGIICGNNISKPYFSKIIKGYHLIFLGTDAEPENEDCAALSAEQLSWFEDEMKEADDSGKPVFVFCHQSVNGNHGLPRTWSEKEDPSWSPEIGGIGKESDAVKAILEKHENVFYFSGHSHMGLCGESGAKKASYAKSFEKHGGVNYINLPCLTRPNHHGDNDKTGQGVMLEVYADKVVIRPRNFVKRRMNKKIIIRDGKPYLEEKLK